MTHSRRRDVLKAAGTVAVLGGLAGCAEQEDNGNDNGGGQEEDTVDSTEQAQQDGEAGAFRVVHASPDAPNVDIYADEEPAIEDLGFGEVSSYAELEAGTYQVQVTAAGDPDTVVFDEEIEIESGMVNTAVAYGEATGGPETGFSVEILEDDLSDPGDDTSRVRLFHAVPDAGAVDVVVTQAPGGDGGDGNETNGGQNQVLFEGVDFGESDTQEVPAGDYTLGVVPAGEENGQPVAEFDLSAEGGTAYSAFAIGYVDPEAADSDAAFEVVVAEDAQGGERADGSAGGNGMEEGDGGTGGDGMEEGGDGMATLSG